MAHFSIGLLHLIGISNMKDLRVRVIGKHTNIAIPITKKATYLAIPSAGIRCLYKKCSSGTTSINQPTSPMTAIEAIIDRQAPNLLSSLENPTHLIYPITGLKTAMKSSVTPAGSFSKGITRDLLACSSDIEFKRKSLSFSRLP